MLASSFLMDCFAAAEADDNCATIPISSASSCGQQQQQDAMIRSFGWSDLPCQGDYLLDLASLMATTTTTTAAETATKTTSPQLPSTNVATTTTTTASASSSHQQHMPEPNDNKQHKSRRRSVRFCKFLQVRTYNVTIGSHPWCRGGMALECDWSHTGTELIDLDVHEEHCSPKRRMPALHLNLQKRRARLQEVTGMSLSELIQKEHIRWAEEQQSIRRQQQQQQLLSGVVLSKRPTKPVASISVSAAVAPSCAL